MTGKVYLMDAAPADPNLLSTSAIRVLRSAEVVFHDDFASPEILDLVPASTQVRNVGTRPGQAAMTPEEVHLQLVSAARTGRQVVCLAGVTSSPETQLEEEIAVLREAGVDFEIVHGLAAGVASGG